jgi:TPR repeat protein
MTVLHRYVSTVDEKTQAHEDLKNAVRELSEGDAVPISYAPVRTLLAWDKQKLANLTTEQLEELGRAWFEGVEDELEPNHLRAFEIWTEATQRGSTEAKYSRAVCLRQGLGVQRDDAAAFRDMKELADSRNYGLAHVSQPAGGQPVPDAFSLTSAACV